MFARALRWALARYGGITVIPTSTVAKSVHDPVAAHAELAAAPGTHSRGRVYDVDVATARRGKEDEHGQEQAKLGDTESLLQDDL